MRRFARSAVNLEPTGCKEIEQLLARWLGASDEDEAPVKVLDGQDADESDVPRRPTSPGGEFDRVAIGLPSDLTIERWRAVGKRISGVADASTPVMLPLTR